MPHGSQVKSHTLSATHSLALRTAMLLLALMLPLVSAAERSDNIIPFTSPHRFMIVVAVLVDGRGPFRFLFDTGATSSAVDPKLSASLHLPPARSVKLASWENTTDAQRVLVDSLSLGPINSGPLAVLVQPLTEFKAFDPDLRGILGQDVLLSSNFLIDNRRHRIQFDNDAVLLQQLTGDRIAIAPVRTRAGDLEPRLISVSVCAQGRTDPLHLLLDSGADMVVLQPVFAPQPTVPRGTKWMADQNGRTSSATTFTTRLSVGSEVFSAEAWIGDTGLQHIVIDGLLPTGSFSQLYVGNQGSFVIFEPRRRPHKVSQSSEIAASSSRYP